MHINPVEHAAMHEARAELLAENTAAAHQRLFLAAVDALTNDPTRPLAVPGFNPGGEWAAHDVVSDWAAGDERVMVDLLRVVGMAAHCSDVGVRLAAQSWVAAMAKRHADFHCEDAADAAAEG